MAIERWTAPGDADTCDAVLYLARCDDCNALVAIGPDVATVHDALRRERPTWQEGLPVFCPADDRYCAERTWLRHGRYLQSVIDSMTAGHDSRRRGA